MTSTQADTIQIPIQLSKLGPATKDYLIANAESGKTPSELLLELAMKAAEASGFSHERHPQEVQP